MIIVCKLYLIDNCKAFDMTDVISFNETQLQKSLTTLDSLKSNGVHWEQVIPVFLSAFFAMLIGISLELFKSSREKGLAAKEQKKRELQQINVAIVSIGYNIEVLLHAVFQNIFPHREQSYEAYKGNYPPPFSARRSGRGS